MPIFEVVTEGRLAVRHPAAPRSAAGPATIRVLKEEPVLTVAVVSALLAGTAWAGQVTVFAAASSTDALTEVIEAFNARGASQ